MAESNEDTLLSKYKASLLGVLLGDCLGSEYEDKDEKDDFSEVIRKLGKKVVQLSKNKKDDSFYYTDDTVLTLAVCKSFDKFKKFDVVELANQIIKLYKENTKRGYGKGAKLIFKELQTIKENKKLKEDCYKPAMEAFDGSGSMANGSGMRISPIALYTLNYDENKMTIITILAIKLTHTHPSAIIGGLQQCYAVREAFKFNKNNLKEVENIDNVLDNMIDSIINYVETIEKDIFKYEDSFLKIDDKEKNDICENLDYYIGCISAKREIDYYTNEYSSRLKNVKKCYHLCRKGEIIDEKMLKENIGDRSSSAMESIPVALFAFLVASDPKCANEVENKINTKRVFANVERVVLYAISLDGDTDTIGSMAGAIAGAFWGLENMTKCYESCEGYKTMAQCANNLYEISNIKK